MKLMSFKFGVMGLRSLHRIALELKRANDNYEITHAPELRAYHAAKTVDRKAGHVYYQSDEALYKDELEAKVREAVKRGEIEVDA